MTKQKIAEVRSDLDKLISAINSGSLKFAVARAVEKLDAILGELPDEPRVMPDLTAGIVGREVTPELEAEFRRRVEEAGFVYGGVWQPGEAFKAEPAAHLGIAQRICHALTDNCVMVTDPERDPCTPENCLAMRAAVK